jgi:hypothetical protein
VVLRNVNDSSVETLTLSGNNRGMNFFVEEYANEFSKAWGTAVRLATAEDAYRLTLKCVEFHEVPSPGTIPKVRWWFVAE